MSREYPERPVVAVGLVVWRADAVLLIRRGRSPINAAWSIPGGRQETGETVRQAGLRELKEETGVVAEISGLVDVVDFIDRDEDGQLRYHYVLVDFAARWRSGEPRPSDDVTEARFVPYSQLDALDLWDETRRVIEEAARLVGFETGNQAFNAPDR